MIKKDTTDAYTRFWRVLEAFLNLFLSGRAPRS